MPGTHGARRRRTSSKSSKSSKAKSRGKKGKAPKRDMAGRSLRHLDKRADHHWDRMARASERGDKIGAKLHATAYNAIYDDMRKPLAQRRRWL